MTRALKAPTLRDSVERLAERARTENWTHEQFLAACLQREVSARDSHGGEGRIRAARFPARKSLEEFDFDHQRSLKRETIAHLGTLDFITAKENAIFLGPPGTGKTMLAIGLGIRACQAGHRVAFATAAEWVARLVAAHHAGRLQAEITKLGRTPLVIIDEVGYIPFEAEAANVFFQLVSARYERASLIVTSNKPFGRWGEVFGDDVVAAAMIDRLVHHAEVISLKGDSYRLRNRDLGRVPRRQTRHLTSSQNSPSERMHSGAQHDRHPVDATNRAQVRHARVVEDRRWITTLAGRQRPRPRVEDPPIAATVEIAHIGMGSQQLRSDRPRQHRQLTMLIQNEHQHTGRPPQQPPLNHAQATDLIPNHRRSTLPSRPAGHHLGNRHDGPNTSTSRPQPATAKPSRGSIFSRASSRDHRNTATYGGDRNGSANGDASKFGHRRVGVGGPGVDRRGEGESGAVEHLRAALAGEQ